MQRAAVIVAAGVAAMVAVLEGAVSQAQVAAAELERRLEVG
jgi:hypothetical protein